MDIVIKEEKTKYKGADQELLSYLLDVEDCSFIQIDLAGTILSCSSGTKHIHGYSMHELIGMPISTFYSDEEKKNGHPWINLKIAKEEGRYECEAWKCKKDGTRFYANTIYKAIYNEDHSIIEYTKFTRDITAQKHLEEENKVLTTRLEEKVQQRTKELEIVNKELEAFSYSVSHDLRAPLRAISGYSTMLKEDYEEKLDSEANRIIDVIVSNTKMMSQLIDDLLTFSKMARLELVDKAVNMKTLAEKCVIEIVEVEKLKYKVNIDDLPPCKGDASMLKQVWLNLLGNAIKYSAKKDNPIIEVGAIEDSKNIIYYVKDNGAGFDMKYYDKLFGVFQRLHRSDEFEGTGLGLVLAKRIISKHGGEIWGKASLNQGATFYFSLPKK
jgi:PAS domain S-box-containing protein